MTLALACAVAACGGDAERAPERRDPDPGAPPPIELPQPIPADPAYLVFSETPLGEQTARRIEQMPPVSIAALASIKHVPVEGPAGATTLRVGAVDPITFRSVAPGVSRNARFVWEELAGGQAVVTFAAADLLDLEDEASIDVASSTLPLGAFADNGIPNIADVLVNQTVGSELGLGPPKWLVVGADPGSNLARLNDRLRRELPQARIATLLPNPPAVIAPETPEAVGEVSDGLIGTMSFRILKNGFIKPDKDWVRANIATAQVPIIGEVTCHRVMIPQLFRALAEVEEQGLARLIRPGDYGGCYVPRFIDRDPTKPLSMHAFGLAVDLNVSTNLLGSRGDMDPRIVEIFEKWGFTWGGWWDRPDPMHFELGRLVET